MAREVSAEMLFARLQTRNPKARSILLAPARRRPHAGELASRLARVIADLGHRVLWVDLTGEVAGPADHPAIESAPSGDLPPQLKSASGPEFDGYIVLCGGPLLESARTLTAVAAVDAVLVLASAGVTARADLEEVRREIAEAGGTLAGAVLM